MSDTPEKTASNMKSAREHDESKLPLWAQERLAIARARADRMRLLALRDTRVRFNPSAFGDDICLANGDQLEIDMKAVLDAHSTAASNPPPPIGDYEYSARKIRERTREVLPPVKADPRWAAERIAQLEDSETYLIACRAQVVKRTLRIGRWRLSLWQWGQGGPIS